MSVTVAPQPSPHIQKGGPSGQVGGSLTFEFTKRKRWADLLIAEFADGINFILSLSSTVLYCSPAVTELLGWKDVDLIDCDFVDLITGMIYLFNLGLLSSFQTFSR